jgi:regulator of sigma E protease
LAIGKVASDSFNASTTLFMQLMAFISINLGIINLLPIPILDGGHIMFILIEIINRGPLSKKKMEMAQQVGLSILLMLMVGAIFNDFARFF